MTPRDLIQEQTLRQRLAMAETINDQLEAEIISLDRALKQIGFEEGVNTVKLAIRELLDTLD